MAEYRAPTGQNRRYVLPHQHHQELIAELLFVDQSTISRTISDLEEIIAEALDKFVSELPEEIEGRVAIVDGSPCPCWSWADAAQLYSGKHKTTGHAHQFVCDLFGRLMHISDPLPGSTHDAKATHETELSELLRDDNAIGDKGYIGTGITTPYRKPAGGELLDWQKEFNTAVNKIRYVIERAISHFKTW
ncbi:MAG TPA: transposase family protein [Pseudonocardiaceae bacterium]